MPITCCSQLVPKGKNIGTIMHIGAGNGNLLDQYLTMKPQKVLLVEANDRLYKALQNKTKRIENVVAEKLWILPGTQDSCSAYILNNPRYNSLCKPKYLLEKYSNLVVSETKTVHGIGFNEFLMRNEFKQDFVNILVLSVQGAEFDLLSNICPDLLSNFEFIITFRYEDNLYEVNGDVMSVLHGLEYHLSFIEQEFGTQVYKVNRALITANNELGKYIIQEKENKAALEERDSKIKQLEQKAKSLSEEVLLLRMNEEKLNKQLKDEKQWHLDNKNWAESLKGELNKLNSLVRSHSRDNSYLRKLLTRAKSDLSLLKIQLGQSDSEKMKLEASKEELTSLVKNFLVALSSSEVGHSDSLEPENSTEISEIIKVLYEDK